jgi:hypothetical protein
MNGKDLQQTIVDLLEREATRRGFKKIKNTNAA